MTIARLKKSSEKRDKAAARYENMMKLIRDDQQDIDRAIKNLAHKNSIIMTE